MPQSMGCRRIFLSSSHLPILVAIDRWRHVCCLEVAPSSISFLHKNLWCKATSPGLEDRLARMVRRLALVFGMTAQCLRRRGTRQTPQIPTDAL
ncbi:hypothetical protein EJ04DRAFT_515504 [Polyplosphaeria fusca]|uniref:Uncharacterized protein n=1 Tax=Polyplosphaeria fusca TaxID=682080 RepID=A0A9P4QPD8_9PLEO|nr:hypothetical protein EJ04DRAFT_515504 [Polyplosphaeria fusca]